MMAYAGCSLSETPGPLTGATTATAGFPGTTLPVTILKSFFHQNLHLQASSSILNMLLLDFLTCALNPPSMSKPGSDWTPSETSALVDAYIWMWLND